MSGKRIFNRFAAIAIILSTWIIDTHRPSFGDDGHGHLLMDEYSDRLERIRSTQQQLPQNPLLEAPDAQNRETPNNYIPDTKDGGIFRSIIDKAEKNSWQQQDFSLIIQQVSEQLLGSKYTPGLLDKTTTETLVISLQEFDCMLFLESVIAIARNITSQSQDYSDFINNVAEQRYAEGKMTDYCSRLHYFSHWIADNQERGLVKNITTSLGGITEFRKLDFMTTHRSSYRQLKNNDANYDCIAKVEQNLNQIPFSYIPTDQIATVYGGLQSGDLVGIATKIKGLDFTHTGLVYKDKNGNTGLIHASPAGSVVIAKDLQGYVANVPQARGIVVARANTQ